MSAQPQQQQQQQEPNPFDEKTSHQEAPGSNVGAISNRPGNAVSRCVEKVSVNTWILVMRIVNILNACMLLAACILSFIGDLATGSKKESNNISSVFLSLYIGMFGTILLIFETRSKLIGSERWIRRTFGFMFTYWGRTCFLIFVGCLNIGLSDTRNEDKEESQDGDVSRDLAHRVVIATASITVINAVFNCMILCSHSGFLNMQEKTTNPADLEEQQVKAYLEAHPELAAQAAQGFETESSQPPPVAADFGSGTAKSSGNTGSKSPSPKQTPQTDAENPFGDNGGSSRPPPAPEKSASGNQQSSGTEGTGGTGGGASAGGKNKKKKKNKKNNQKEASGGAAASGSAQKKEENPFEDDNPFA